jgi:polyisoprenoid-binding protein YceI
MLSVTVWSRTITTLIASLAWSAAVSAQPRPIDTAKSTITVRVFKAGVLSALGHDHEIGASIAGGTVDPAGNQVELRAQAGAMKVRDSGVSDKDREQIQSTMLGPEVLDAGTYPDIVFRSTSVEHMGEGSWKVQGSLTLHGKTSLVMVEVRDAGGHYVGTSRFKLTDFGIKPIKVAGGSIRVKDEIRVEFDIQLAR